MRGMKKSEKIYIAGHSGLVGSAIERKLINEGFGNLIHASHKELDLLDQKAVNSFFEKEKPDYVFLAAAKVGGIHANETALGDFLYENLVIETNVIRAAYINNVKKLMFLGSGCIYPRDCPQPIKEEFLLTSPLEKTNEGYAIAKIAGLKLCEFYNKQYGTNYISCMPCNLYGPGDNYHPKHSHVIPALIRKFHEAMINGAEDVTLWGTGKALREFLYIDDVADGIVFLMQNYDGTGKNGIESVNIGCGVDVRISELADIIKTIVGFKGNIVYDSSYPDGTPRKLLDSSKLFDMGWSPKTELYDGLEATYKDYIKNNKNYRS